MKTGDEGPRDEHGRSWRWIFVPTFGLGAVGWGLLYVIAGASARSFLARFPAPAAVLHHQELHHHELHPALHPFSFRQAEGEMRGGRWAVTRCAQGALRVVRGRLRLR